MASGLAQHLAYPQTPWKVSDSLFQRLQDTPPVPNTTFRKCEILPIDPEWLFIYRLFFSDQPTNKTIRKAYCLHNPAVSRQFEGHLSNMEKEAQNPFFAPKWKQENPVSLRQKAVDRWKQTVAPFSPLKIDWGKRVDKFTHVNVRPLWHGSDLNKCISVAETGFTFFGKHAALKGGPTGPSTDVGYFGSGIYFTDSAFYADNIYANGHLLLAWVSMREPYPVVADRACMPPYKPSDMKKLEGLGAYQNYNAHYIPVVSIYPGNPYCGVYYPCTASQTPRCDEVVVFSNSQTLARFWIETEPEMTKPIPANASTLILKQVMDLLQEQAIKGNPRLLKFFQDKQQVLVAIGPAGTLSLEEQGFFHWVSEFFDTTGKTKSVALNKFTTEAFPKLTYLTPTSTLVGGVHLSQAHPEFFGREKLLQELEASLFSKAWKPSDSTLVKVLVGHGGMGKTETAIKFGNDHLDDFSLVWTLHCESSDLLEQDVRHLADLLKIYHEKTPFQDLVKEVNKKLESGFLHKPFLLILDNVIETPPLPQRGGAVLMTSNLRSIWPYPSAFVEVTPFSLEEAAAVIQKVDPNADQKDIQSLHRMLDGSPLLLSVAAHYMATSNVTLPDYLIRMQKKPPLFEATSDGRYTRSLAQVYQLTLELLEQKDPTAFEFFQLCAYLNPDRITPSFSESIKDKKGKQPVGESSGGDPFRTLSELSLLRYDHEKRQYTIHRNLQFFLQKTHEMKNIQSKMVNEVASLLSKKVDAFDQDDLSTWEVMEKYSSHVEFLLKSSFAGQINLDPQIAKSWNNLGMAWHSLGDYAKAVQYYEEALGMRRQIYGDRPHLDIAGSWNNLGVAWHDLGDCVRDMEYHEKALKMRRQIYGDRPHRDIAGSWNNLGNAWDDLGDYAKAVEYNEKALEMQRQIYGDKPHQDIARSWNNLGNAWHHLRDYVKAVEYHEKALKMRRQIYGDKPHQDIARSWNNLGNAWHHLRDYAKAVEYNEKALEMQRQIYGDKPHLDIAGSWNNLGNAWHALGDYVKATEYYGKALEMSGQIFGDKPHQDIVTSWNNLGVAWRSLGDMKNAKECLEKAYRMNILLFGENHPKTQSSKKKLKTAKNGCSLL